MVCSNIIFYRNYTIFSFPANTGSVKIGINTPDNRDSTGSVCNALYGQGVYHKKKSNP